MNFVYSLFKGDGHIGYDAPSTSTSQSEGGSSFVDVLGQSRNLTTYGRPALVLLTSIGSQNQNFGGNLTGTGRLRVIRDAATVIWDGVFPRFNGMPVIMLYDPVAAGTYNWNLQVNNAGGTSVTIGSIALVVYELGT